VSADLCHINFARGFRGGERQTELLIRALAAALPSQRLLFRAGAPLGARVEDVPGVRAIPIDGRSAAVRASRGAALIHAHETGGAQAAWINSWFFSTPYLITRRVDYKPKAFFLTRQMYRRAACVVAQSSAIADVLKTYESRLDVRKIPDACSNLPFDAAVARAFRERHSGKFLVGQVAAFDFAHKGQPHLLAAAARLEGIRPEIHFVFVGSGRDDAALRELAARRRNVTVEGWTENVGDYLAAFDLFAYPSNWEGMGSILIDAMQFGLPIVATRAGGIPDLIKEERNGLLVPVQNADALAEAILRLFSDPALRNAMTQANRETAGEYTPEIMAQRYLALYAELAPRLRVSRVAP
jgi:glycosyltransferase involved in cell wall biosynthesis